MAYHPNTFGKATCPQCGEAFDRVNWQHIYCSKGCKWQAWNSRHPRQGVQVKAPPTTKVVLDTGRVTKPDLGTIQLAQKQKEKQP